MTKLVRAPLQEVIFEVRWQLVPDTSGKQLIDPDYQFALGPFRNMISNEFPYHVAKIPVEFPHQMLPYKLIHQFWKGENEWPVIQIGPGIMSVNDTEKNYEWEETYKPLITKVINALVKSYPKINIIVASLRYIDVVRIEDYDFNGWENFIEENFNFNFQNSFETGGTLSGIQINQSFDIADTGILNVNFSNGKNKKNEEIFIFQSSVVKQKAINAEDLSGWLEEAHNHTSKLFKDICKKEFYATFS